MPEGKGDDVTATPIGRRSEPATTVTTQRKPRKVTREEFVRLMMASGKTQDEALLQAKVSAALGSVCLVGGEWLKIEEVKP